ncbi:MAG TPA: SDR family NAD(P)-dependent oxidoreductase [Candidatus Dormibacteraeota bacterium]
MRFEGKVALVTGGANGIGAATSELFAKEGASVVVVDLEQAPADETAKRISGGGGKAIGVACDVTQREQVEAAIKRATDEYGRLDILVCCAGIIRDNLVFKMTDDDWFAVINTHLTGSFFAARAAQAVMTEQKYGKIVFLSSTSALGNRGQTNYSTAKAGLQGMARTLAIELGRFNINVNAVAPGFVETRMTESTARRMGVDWEEFKKAAAANTPLQRVGQPVDIANVIAFLCSDDSSFVTGQTIYAAGGPRS